MSLTINYKGVDIVNETADCNKTLKTAGKYCEADIGVEYTSEAPTLISKSITANGEYSASADGADGYSSVSVNVPQPDTLRTVLNRSVTSATIHSDAAAFPQALFQYCADLVSVTIENGIASLPMYAFEHCTSLSSVTIPASVTSIASAAFRGCTSLALFIIPSTVTSIGNNILQNCTSLSSVTIPNSISTIPNAFVAGCTSLTSVKLPSSITLIQSAAFSVCPALLTYDFTELTATGGTANTTLVAVNAFSNIAGEAVMVFADEATMNAYKTATNWASYASYMTYVGA